jgi:hypothetical protein
MLYYVRESTFRTLSVRWPSTPLNPNFPLLAVPFFDLPPTFFSLAALLSTLGPSSSRYLQRALTRDYTGRDARDPGCNTKQEQQRSPVPPGVTSPPLSTSYKRVGLI